MKQLLRSITPPIITNAVKIAFTYLRKAEPAEWEYLGPDWGSVPHCPSKKWDQGRVAEVMAAHWDEFLASIAAPQAFGLSNESIWGVAEDRNFHNDVMSFAYVLSLCIDRNSSVRVLDWGGSFGHYHQIAKSLFPQNEFNYHVQEVSSLVRAGASLNHAVQFFDMDCELEKDAYDLVFASSSIHYCEDWRSQLAYFAEASKRYVFVTRFPVSSSRSFVFLQRPKRFGYDTEYAGWCFNKSEFIAGAAQAGLKLEREFLLLASVKIDSMKEPMQFSGFLFSVR